MPRVMAEMSGVAANAAYLRQSGPYRENMKLKENEIRRGRTAADSDTNSHLCVILPPTCGHSL